MKVRNDRCLLASALVVLLAVSALAIDGPFRVSEFGGGVQIWFEAEHYDERDPDTEDHYRVVAEDGAFGPGGEAINRVGGGGRLTYTFDIDRAEGVGGTWYMWGRVINPSNSSDYMLVEDHPGDPDIPDFPPYPAGDGTPPFENDDDRVFERNTGPPWGWSGGGSQGHTKELQDGENIIHFFHRQGNTSVFWDVIMFTDDPGYNPNDDDYLNADVEDAEPCVDPADTHCRGIMVEGPAGNVAGTYNVVVDAVDDGDDEIIYLLTADNGVDEPKTVRQNGDNVLQVFLPAGTWAISVTVDDNLGCDDEAADATCTADPIEVLPKGPRPLDKPYRVSNHDGGHQVWFEAEDFAERIPDTEDFFPVIDDNGALNGQVITRAGGAGGCVRWDFDINEADGQAGKWYMWGRVLNPSNNSDYMLVEGDPGDLSIPDVEPYPGGDGAAPFENGDDRVFEGNVGPPFGWFGNEEGHSKQLQDGVNSMFLFHRQGNASKLVDVIMWSDTQGYRPSDEDYLNAEILNAPPCEDPPDTHCFGIDLAGAGENGDEAGTWTVTVNAEDDGNDRIFYVVTADNGFDPPTIVRSLGDNVLPIVLDEGEWTITATVDDDLLCDDEAADNTCTEGPFTVAPRQALRGPRKSAFGDAIQIWFEAEHFDERIPDNEDFFPVLTESGAFGEVVGRAGGAGGRIRWDFDLTEIEGAFGGMWYMWGRVLNPSNSSDYMLVDGDIDDPEIPDTEPFPGGDATPPFDNADDRVFEGNVGPPFGWYGSNDEGHVKELFEDENSMYIFHRQGNATVFWDVFCWTNSPDYTPTDDDYVASEEIDPGPPPTPRPTFHRGDTNGDGTINIADAVGMLNFLFGGGTDTTCKETQDFDNDGSVVITDAVAILLFLFSSGADPAPPGAADQPCGQDPDAPNAAGDLGCNTYTSC